MWKQLFDLKSLTITPDSVHLYVPPILWKGDSVGHIGKSDVFFLVLEGECFLNIDSQNYIVKKGQLAYLPKGKMRIYTQVSEKFSMYEMRFAAQANGEDLMEVLGLTGSNFVVELQDGEAVRKLFEDSTREELFKNPLFDVAWCANIINIIRIYAEERQKQSGEDNLFFKPVLEYMTSNMAKQIKLEDLASIVYMHPTYFVKRFGDNFGVPPLVYLNRMRMYKAMGMLSGTEKSIEEISKAVGVSDSSYFARMFKKHAGVSPTEYRGAFKRLPR